MLTKSKAIANQNKQTLSLLMRAFASSPQKNPFDKVKTTLGGSSFYKLPSLGDRRLGKLKPLGCSNIS